MVYTQYKRAIRQFLPVFLVFVILTSSTGCEKKGLVTEKYPREFYHVSRMLPDKPIDENPRFIFYGDNRPGWRINERFIRRKNWLTWKMFIPFYRLYWFSNGLVGGIDYLRHVPDYGARERRMVRDAIYAEAKSSKLGFIINGGDMPNDGRYPSHWETFLKENKIDPPLLSEFPFLPVIGNHEKANDQVYGLPNYEAIFDYPGFYTLDFPDAAIFVVDSNIIVDQYQFIDDEEQDALFRKWFVSGEDSEQPGWLERELASRNQAFKIVVIHHPPISFGRHHANWLDRSFGRNLQEKRQKLLRLFHKQRVQVVLCGHEHFYEHIILPYSPDASETESKIHFFVSGGGGVPLRSLSNAEKINKFLQNYRAEGLDVHLVKQEEIYHYCLIQVDPDQITIRVLEVTGDSREPLKLAEEILIPKAAK